MDQLSIFDTPAEGRRSAPPAATPPRARSEDATTSQLAAARVGEFAGDHYVKILAALDFGPSTIYEIAERTGLTSVQVARRMPELGAGEKVRPTRTTRASPSGRQCRIWELAT